MEIPPLTHSQSVANINAFYEVLIERDGYARWSESPLRALPLLILFVYFLLPKSIDSRYLRVFTWLCILTSSVYLLLFTRAKNPSNAGLLGLTSVYLVLLATTHLLGADPKGDYQRVAKKYNRNTDARGSGEYYLESFPENLAARYFWTVDLLTTITGRAWNFTPRGITDLPKSVLQSLFPENTSTVNGKLLKSTDDGARAPDVRNRHLLRVAIDYILVDFFKTLSTHDPYFLGDTKFGTPRFLPPWLSESGLFVHIVRMAIALSCILLAIDAILRIRPVLYLCFHTFAKWLNIHEPSETRVRNMGVTAEGWFWSEPFGDYRAIGEMGLLGFWSRFWHQAFRLPFEGTWNVIVLYLGLSKAKTRGYYVFRLFVVFVLSGFMHAALSYTTVGETRPFLSVLFFVLQPIGILMQNELSKLLCTYNVFTLPSPGTLGLGQRAFNYVFVVAWLLLTAPLLVEDFSRGGLFLFEPVPFSFVRALGWGDVDAKWRCWSGKWLE